MVSILDITSEVKSELTLPSWHQHEVDRADAVVLVCSQGDGEDWSNEAAKWLEAIRSSASSSKRRGARNTPVILAASKSDQTRGNDEAFDNSAIQRACQSYNLPALVLTLRAADVLISAVPEVEAIVACSAVGNHNVAEGKLQSLIFKYCLTKLRISYLIQCRYCYLKAQKTSVTVAALCRFWHAQQATESPLYPLYDAEKKVTQDHLFLAQWLLRLYFRYYALLRRKLSIVYSPCWHGRTSISDLQTSKSCNTESSINTSPHPNSTFS